MEVDGALVVASYILSLPSQLPLAIRLLSRLNAALGILSRRPRSLSVSRPADQV